MLNEADFLFILFYIKTMGVEEGGFKVTCAIT